jgi:flagellar motility protein MotE (MotC chaperone)
MTKKILSLFLFFLLFSSPAAIGVEPPGNKDTAKNEQQFSSVEERRLLLALQQERLNLVKEREELENRKKDLKRLEAEVDKKLDQLQTTRLQIEQLLEEKDAVEIKKIQDISKMYEKMSPDKAAGILSTLDLDLAVAILAKMKTKSAAKVLNNMNRDKAAKISTAFTTLN